MTTTQQEEEPISVRDASRALGYSEKTAMVKYHENRFEKLVNTIFEIGNEEIITHVCISESIQFPVRYYAQRGKAVYKSGKREGQEYDCWISCYGKFAGSKKVTKPPICTAWITYNSSDFYFVKEAKGKEKFKFRYQAKPYYPKDGRTWKYAIELVKNEKS